MPQTAVSSFMSNVADHRSCALRLFWKRIHRLTRRSPNYVKHLCTTAAVLTPKLSQAIDEVNDFCEVCAQSGRPLPSKEISLNNVNMAFIVDLQINVA